jgi:hypothetical protein
MSLAQASWITVVVICAIATAVTAIAGYAGYAATIAAVGVAASVNLIPRHSDNQVGELRSASQPNPPSHRNK